MIFQGSSISREIAWIYLADGTTIEIQAESYAKVKALMEES
jgi:hypothetical protein